MFYEKTSRSERGAALVVGLVMLALLSLLGVTAYSIATLEERIAGNARDQARAFEAAEVAARECERVLAAGTTTGTGFYSAPTAPQAEEVWQSSSFTWADTETHVLPATIIPSSTTTGSEWSRRPRCIVEEIRWTTPSLNPSEALVEQVAYRITARGYGLNQSTIATVQSFYRP